MNAKPTTLLRFAARAALLVALTTLSFAGTEPFPGQDEAIRQAYQAPSRAAAIYWEAHRDRLVLEQIGRMEAVAWNQYYLASKSCREMQGTAAVACYKQASRELQIKKRAIEAMYQNEAALHARNIQAINDVWDRRAKWAPQPCRQCQ